MPSTSCQPEKHISMNAGFILLRRILPPTSRVCHWRLLTTRSTSAGSSDWSKFPSQAQIIYSYGQDTFSPFSSEATYPLMTEQLAEGQFFVRIRGVHQQHSQLDPILPWNGLADGSFWCSRGCSTHGQSWPRIPHLVRLERNVRMYQSCQCGVMLSIIEDITASPEVNTYIQPTGSIRTVLANGLLVSLQYYLYCNLRLDCAPSSHNEFYSSPATRSSAIPLSLIIKSAADKENEQVEQVGQSK